MKIKRIVTGLALLVLSTTLIFIACKKDPDQSRSSNGVQPTASSNAYVQRTNGLEITTDNAGAFEADYELASGKVFEYSATKISDKITKSTLKIYTGSSTIIFSYTENANEPAYRLNEHNKVIVIANEKKPLFSSASIEDLEPKFETFAKMILNSTNNYGNAMVQSLFYHNAILKTIKRSILNNTECVCTPLPEYFVGRTGFWSQEDYKYTRTSILAAFDSIPPANANDSALYAFVSNHIGEEIAAIDITNVYMTTTTFMNSVNSCYQGNTNPQPSQAIDCCNGPGNAPGCCGSYGGCCWVRHPLCMAHDILCANCDHWYCGFNCTPVN